MFGAWKKKLKKTSLPNSGEFNGDEIHVFFWKGIHTLPETNI